MQPGSEWVAVIIEDDPDVRDLIDIVLTQSGFRTVVTENGPDGVEAVRQHNPLITTLDVNMPGMDGFAAAKRLREFSNTYLIMITALADEIDVVQGFEAGADDYLVKPFRPRELRARADSMLRRPRTRFETPAGWAGDDPGPAEQSHQQESWAAAAARDLAAEHPLQPLHPQPPAPQPQPVQPVQPVQQPTYPQHPPAEPVQPAPQAYPPQQPQAYPPAQPAPVAPAPQHLAGAPGAPPHQGGWVQFNGLALNAETRVVTVNGAAVDLTRTEFDLLASLLSTGRRVRSKADLVLTMRGQQYVTSYFVNEADKRSVEVHIANLRRKIGDDAATPRYIETVRGVGYRLAESV
jgi:DNA-binding response OmpR family regulator